MNRFVCCQQLPFKGATCALISVVVLTAGLFQHEALISHLRQVTGLGGPNEPGALDGAAVSSTVE